MECLGYLLVYFMRGSLPWQGLKAIVPEEKEKLILEKKKTTSSEELCSGLPDEFARYFDHVRSLRFGDKPDYRYLSRMFRNLFKRKRFEYDNVFDWTILKFLMVTNSSIETTNGKDCKGNKPQSASTRLAKEKK